MENNQNQQQQQQQNINQANPQYWHGRFLRLEGNRVRIIAGRAFQQNYLPQNNLQNHQRNVLAEQLAEDPADPGDWDTETQRGSPPIQVNVVSSTTQDPDGRD